jgi:hypothetical protein
VATARKRLKHEKASHKRPFNHRAAIIILMRSLAEPAVLKSAAFAAGLMSVACYPRLAMAVELRYPVWYLESVLCLGGMVLWAFTFAWYPRYTRQPLFRLQAAWRLWTVATLIGIGGAVLVHHLIDPALQTRSPSEFPSNLYDWVARVLFNLAFTQLLLVFAPFAWLLRLFQRTAPAIAMTVLFGLAILVVKNYRDSPMSPGLLGGLIIFRVAASIVSSLLFLRGGVIPVWWCALILQSRHLFEMKLGTP